jgi:hypothetical protein
VWRRTIGRVASDNNQIDVLKNKLNPLILGQGVPIFGKSRKDLKLESKETEEYDHGLQIMTYELSQARTDMAPD